MNAESHPPNSTTPPRDAERRARAREILRVESEAIAHLGDLLDAEFDRAVDLVLACDRFVVVTGVGKAGLIGTKISATLASTGTPSFFLHPCDALHGDLGRIRSTDVVLALSNSGESREIVALLPHLKKLGARIIAISASRESTLPRHADAVLTIGTVEEAGPLNIAPTTSAAALLAMGDALAMVLVHERRFTIQDFALYHPAGSLGRKLMKVHEVMRRDEQLPLVPLGLSVRETLRAMSATPGRPGAAIIVTPDGKLAGLFTDGDLRRFLETPESVDLPIVEVMTPKPKVICADALVSEALFILKKYKIDQIVIVDDRNIPIGLLDVQDLLELDV